MVCRIAPVRFRGSELSLTQMALGDWFWLSDFVASLWWRMASGVVTLGYGFSSIDGVVLAVVLFQDVRWLK